MSQVQNTQTAGSGSAASLRLSHRTSRMKASAIREILALSARPDVISLAGGLPSPESFPIDVVSEYAATAIRGLSSSSLQYGPTEGSPSLREVIGQYIKPTGVEAPVEEVCITTGSQGSLDAIGKIFISEGDHVAVESPTYLGALTAFNPYGPQYLEIETDDDGVIPESLEEILRSADVKFVYLVPTFQNPSGRTISLDRRHRIARLIEKYDALLIEDDPYWALRFRGEALPAIKSLVPHHVIYLGTLSKVLAPGLRIGFCVAPPHLTRWLVLAKQGVDLHTSSLDQEIACRYIASGSIGDQVPRIIELYRPRCEAMLSALAATFPTGSTWSKPDGGMFVWAECPDQVDTLHLYHEALKHGVAFVPGRYFFCQDNRGLSTMRLNFTCSDEAAITRAITILAELAGRAIENPAEVGSGACR